MDRRGFLLSAFAAPALTVPVGVDAKTESHVVLSMDGGPNALRIMVGEAVNKGLAAYDAALPDRIRNIERNPRRL